MACFVMVNIFNLLPSIAQIEILIQQINLLEIKMYLAKRVKLIIVGLFFLLLCMSAFGYTEASQFKKKYSFNNSYYVTITVKDLMGYVYAPGTTPRLWIKTTGNENVNITTSTNTPLIIAVPNHTISNNTYRFDI